MVAEAVVFGLFFESSWTLFYLFIYAGVFENVPVQVC